MEAGALKGVWELDVLNPTDIRNFSTLPSSRETKKRSVTPRIPTAANLCHSHSGSFGPERAREDVKETSGYRYNISGHVTANLEGEKASKNVTFLLGQRCPHRVTRAAGIQGVRPKRNRRGHVRHVPSTVMLVLLNAVPEIQGNKINAR